MPKLQRVDVASITNQTGDPQITHIRYPRRSCRRSLLCRHCVAQEKPKSHLGHDRRRYNLVCRYYALSARLKLQFLHNLLTSAAKVFLLDMVLPVASTYEDAVDHVHREYRPVVQQEQMKNDLSNLRVIYLVGKGMAVDVALVEVYKRVSSRSRMVPAAY